MDAYITPFTHYMRLYTLHQIERPPDLVLLRIRIETLRYSFAPLSSMPLDAAYASDPREGVEVVRQAVLPRLQTLLDTNEPFSELKLLDGPGAIWPRYAASRGLSADPVRVPVIHAPTGPRKLPARSKTSEWLARTQHALELFQTAVETASTLAAIWQNWQIGQERRNLLAAQRTLLQDAIQAQLTGQTRALDHGLDRGFVRGYLAEHSEDSAVDVLFSDLGEPGSR
jgi:hypothetical protein